MPGIVGRSLATCAVCSLICSPTQVRKLCSWGWRLGNGVSGMSGRRWHLLQHAPHQQLKLFVQDLNHIYRSEPALHNQDFQQAGFEWIDCSDNRHSGLHYYRRAQEPEDFIITVCNFTPQPHRTTVLARSRDFIQNCLTVMRVSTVVAIWKSWWQMDR